MFTVFSKPDCPYCEMAKSLLQSKGLEFTELVLDTGQLKDPSKTYYTVNQLREKVPTARTVPQIFHHEVLIGGFEALKHYLADNNI